MVSDFISEASSLFSGFDFTAQLANLTPSAIIGTMITATLCGFIVYLVYRFFYRGVVYSDNFNILLVLTTVVTAFIIMTISANVVLSLGMVGALSIVRFRAAVKDPLDIGFLFWGISAGITAGAQLYWVAIIGTVCIAVIYILFTIFKKEKKSYLLIVRYTAANEINVNGLLGNMKYKLKSKTQTGDHVELTIEVKIKHNDVSYVSRFNEIEGVESVTMLEYSGEYMN